MTDANLIELGRRLEVYERYFWEYCEPTSPKSDEEEIAASAKLDELDEGLYQSIITERADTAEGIAVKIAAILHANKSGKLSWEERFEEAYGYSDAVA